MLLRIAFKTFLESSERMPGQRTTNSSPPRRPTKSLSRTQEAQWTAKWRSTRSPVSWPEAVVNAFKMVEVYDSQA